MKKFIKGIICGVLCVALVVSGILIYNHRRQNPKTWKVEGDDKISEIPFEDELEQLDMMQNTWQSALSQTEIYNMLKAHFESPLPEGKTVKKAIVIGYDGCRVDTFRLLKNSKRSSINMLLDDGGQAVFSYCGGVNYPEANIQDTSTAPGWCSMLTGVLSDVHHITGNGITKELEPRTFLLESVEDGIVNSSAFYVSWKGHFSRKNATYNTEKEYIEKNNLNVVFKRAKDDIGTRSNVLSDLKQKDCSDFIFLTLEFTDHNGHASGFSLQNPNYVNAFRNADATGADFIEAIKARENYDKEDWLILITTDHGGIKKDHGGDSFEERITFIVSNREIVQ